MSDTPYYEPPHGQLAQIIPADGWCAVDDDDVHVPIVAWTLVKLDDDLASLVPFVSRYDEPAGSADRGTILDAFEPVGADNVLMCGSRCERYRENYIGNVPASYHFGAYPLPGGLGRWHVVQVMPASGWCAVYDVSRVEADVQLFDPEDPFAHSPLTAWALIEERQGKPKQRWRGVVGLDAHGSVTGPTVAANFVRYSRCGMTVDIEHLEWRYDEDEETEDES